MYLYVFLKVNLLLYIFFIKFHLEAIESGLSIIREYQIKKKQRKLKFIKTFATTSILR